MQRFVEELVSQLKVHIKDDNLSGLYRHLKGVESEGKQPCSSQNTKDAKDLLVDMELVRGQWVQCFSVFLITKSPMLDANIADEFKVWPSCIPLDYLPSVFEVIETIKGISN